jgi:parvulin-like peptidyl-prolyl isomerase
MAGKAVDRDFSNRAFFNPSGSAFSKDGDDRIMNRLWVVSMLSLAMAGCAQSRSAISKRDEKPPEPVALTPIPPVYDTINRGMGGPAVARTAMKKPDDPMWNGRDQVTTVAAPVSNGQNNSGPDPSQLPPSVIAGQAPQPTGPALRATPAQAAAPAASSLAVSELPIQNTLSPAPVLSGPVALEAAGGPIASAKTAMPNPAPITGPAPLSIQAPRPGSPGLTANVERSSPSVNKPQVNTLPQSSPPADVAVSPSVSQPPLTPAPAGSTKAPVRRGDPLLGPSPDLMPEMPPLPDEKPSAAASPAPAGPPIELAPASSPPAEPGSGAAAGPEPAGPLSAVDPSAIANKPAPAGKLAAVPLEPAPLGPALVSSSASTTPEAAALRIPKQRDPQIIKASFQPPPPREPVHKDLGKEAGFSVARVGDEVITSHDLIVAAREQLHRQPDLNSQLRFDTNEELEKHKQVPMVVKYTLDSLIERSLLVQEAKHAIKDSKQLDKMMEIAEQVWRTEQVPQLKQRFSAETEQQLKEKLAASGRSLDHMHTTFRQDFLGQGYLQDRLKDKLKIELPDELKYYNDHINDREFQLPAQITWRELVVETNRYPSRQEAQKKASALLEKLRRGEDFAKLARAESDGPSSSRNEGGLMQTSPGSYAVQAVNQALGSLPVGKVSGILEGPTSLHIVRVEGRRPAGPASFEDLRQKIRPMLFDEKVKTERTAFINKLRQRTLIQTMFDAPPRGQPNQLPN